MEVEINFNQFNDEVLEHGLKFVENFSGYLDHLPPLLQRKVTRLKEIDASTRKHLNEAEHLYGKLIADKTTKESAFKYQTMRKLIEIMGWCQQLGDEKTEITEQVKRTIDRRTAELDKRKEEFMSSYNPLWKEELRRKRDSPKTDSGRSAKRSKRRTAHHFDKDKSTGGLKNRGNVMARMSMNSSNSLFSNLLRQAEVQHNDLFNSSSSSSSHRSSAASNSTSAADHKSNVNPSTTSSNLVVASSDGKSSREQRKSRSPDHRSQSPAAFDKTDASDVGSASPAATAAAYMTKTSSSSLLTSSSSGRNGSYSGGKSSSATPKSGGKYSSAAAGGGSHSTPSNQKESNTGSGSARAKNKKKKKVKVPAPRSPSPQEVQVNPDDDPIYCICRQVSFGAMICCDNKKCRYEWFHFQCVGLTQKPKNNKKWYCSECRQKDRKNRMDNR